MAIRHSFEPNAGYRFFKGNVSVLLHAAARFKRDAVVTNIDLFNFFRHLNRYLQNVGAYEFERQGPSKLMTADNFLTLEGAVFYKFMSDSTLSHFMNGSFQLGSISYYRSIEQQNSKDAMEGLANIAFQAPGNVFGLSLASGYNFGIFCGAQNLDRCAEMSERFGPRIIRIANLQSFAEEIKILFGANRFYYGHVIYNDLKLLRAKTLKTIRLSQEPSTNFDPALINDALFDLLYKTSFHPSLFMKPTRFAIEDELRLVFEMPVDVPPPYVLRKANVDLMKHIDIIR
ncbi:hypothetical protein [Bradyrhizobium lablabi]|uniref:hypothetical protein n=1 Tax=Bradyrhizobium lablabi TaxID=722472 RepID=UPI001BAC5D39|nr:hypothetical protein [Bradyrhizobium lablabi]MBR0695566.1 hypothetical protein [Bradyrhizobium lablabi]